MPSFFVVMARMSIGGRVAAQHLAALLADPQMHPAAIGFNALFTTKGGVVGFGNYGVCRQCF